MKRKEHNPNVFAKTVPLLALALFLGACAAVPGKTPQSLEARAQARWDALLAEDFERAYFYLTPGIRSSVTVTEFEIGFRLRKVTYLSAKYLDHECAAEDSCTVRMDMGYKLLGALRGVPVFKGSAVVNEKWLRIDGQWWFLPEK